MLINSPYQRAEQFAEAMDGECFVVTKVRHPLGEDYVLHVLDKWLSPDLGKANFVP